MLVFFFPYIDPSFFFLPFPVLFHCLCKGLTHYAFHPPVISDPLLVSNPCFCPTPSVLFTSHSLGLLFPYVCLLSIQLLVLSHSVCIPLCVCPTLCMPHPVHAPHYMRATLRACPPCIYHSSCVLYLYPTPSVSHSVGILLRVCPSLRAYPTRVCPTHVCPTPYVSPMCDLFHVLSCVSRSVCVPLCEFSTTCVS